MTGERDPTPIATGEPERDPRPVMSSERDRARAPLATASPARDRRAEREDAPTPIAEDTAGTVASPAPAQAQARGPWRPGQPPPRQGAPSAPPPRQGEPSAPPFRPYDPQPREPRPLPSRSPAAEALCVTRGVAAVGAKVNQPTVRAVARNTAGDAATLAFTYRGDSEHARALASGATRRQLGLKLRAANSCNLVYVMWRLDPKPKLEVSVKLNPGKTSNQQCGTEGYTKLKPLTSAPLPDLAVDSRHSMRAAIAGDELTAWIDDREVWRGRLPAGARDLRGFAGLRSDNVSYELIAFEAATGDARQKLPKCVAEDGD